MWSIYGIEYKGRIVIVQVSVLIVYFLLIFFCSKQPQQQQQ